MTMLQLNGIEELAVVDTRIRYPLVIELIRSNLNDRQLTIARHGAIRDVKRGGGSRPRRQREAVFRLPHSPFMQESRGGETNASFYE